MFKTFIFKQLDDILKDSSKYTKDTRCNKGHTKSYDISSTFYSLGEMFNQRT